MGGRGPGVSGRAGRGAWSWRQLHSPAPVAREVQDIGARRERQRLARGVAAGEAGGLRAEASTPSQGAPQQEPRRRWWPRREPRAEAGADAAAGAPVEAPGPETPGGRGAGRREGIVGVLQRARAADAAAACLLQLMSTLQRLRFVVEQLESVSEGSVRDHAMRVLEHVQRMAAVEWHALELQVQALGSEGGAEASADVEGLGPFVSFIEGTLRHLQGLATEMLEGEESKGLSDAEFKRLLTTTSVGVADQAYLHNVDPPQQCSVCLLDFQPTDTLTQLPCNWRHVFHRHCIRGWLSRQSSCPLCRSSCRLPPPRQLDCTSAEGSEGSGPASAPAPGGEAAPTPRAGGSPGSPGPRLLWVAQAEAGGGRPAEHVSVLQLRRLHSQQVGRGRVATARPVAE